MNKEPIPGTFEEGFVEHPIVETGDGGTGIRDYYRSLGMLGIKFFMMGECRIVMSKDPAGVNDEKLWHMTISCRDRHPSWDEIKTARYRLLPLDRCFGMLLPQPEVYVNLPEQDHVFQLWEIDDPRAPWTTG